MEKCGCLGGKTGEDYHNTAVREKDPTYAIGYRGFTL